MLGEMFGCCGNSPSLSDAVAYTVFIVCTNDGRRFRLSEVNNEACNNPIADELTLACPSCQEATQARLDPLTFAFPSRRGLLREVSPLQERAYQDDGGVFYTRPLIHYDMALFLVRLHVIAILR